MDKGFVMKFQVEGSLVNTYYLYWTRNYGEYFTAEWRAEGDFKEGKCDYSKSNMLFHINNGGWKQIPNTIEDMEVGDYVEWSGDSGEYFTKGKLYKILKLFIKDGLVLLTDDKGATFERGTWSFTFHKKAYVELFMNDKLQQGASITKEKEMEPAKPQFKNMKFRVKDEEHSKLIQEELFKLGYEWNGGKRVQYTDKEFLYTDENGWLSHGGYESTFLGYPPIEHHLVPEKYSIVEVKHMIEVEGYKVDKAKLLEFLKSQ